MWTVVLAGIAVVLTLSTAHAEIAEIVGHGATTCAEFLRDYERDPIAERVYFAWAQGYMSAILVTRPPGTDDRLDLAPSELPVKSQLGFVREYCAQHAERNYSDAIEALYHRLRSIAPKQPAGP